MLEHERLHSSDVCVQFVSHDQLVIGKDRTFRFDQVFPPNSPQVNKLKLDGSQGFTGRGNHCCPSLNHFVSEVAERCSAIELHSEVADH